MLTADCHLESYLISLGLPKPKQFPECNGLLSFSHYVRMPVFGHASLLYIHPYVSLNIYIYTINNNIYII